MYQPSMANGGASRFQIPLGNTGMMMDPRTNEIYDPQVNRVYSSPDELAGSLSTYESGQSSQSSGGNGLGQAAGGLGSASTAYSLYSGLGGGTGSALGSTAGTTGGYELAGTLGSTASGGIDLSAGSTLAGGGYGATAASIAPFVAAPVYAYSMNEALPRAYNEGQGQGLTGGVQEGIKPSKGTDYMSYAIDPFFTPQILAAAGAIGGLFGSKREGERKSRKEGRRMLQNAGLMGPDSRSIYSLADGSGYDIRTRPDRAAYNVDFNEEGAGERVGLLNALTNAIVGGKKDKPRSDLTGELYNSYMSNGKFDENARSAFDKAGGRDAIYNAVAQRWNKEELNADQRDANFAAIDKLYGIANPTGSRWDAQLTGKDAERNQKELAKAQEGKPSNTAPQKPEVKPVSSFDPNRPVAGVRSQPLNPNAVSSGVVRPIPKGGSQIETKKPSSVNPRLKGKR